MIEDFLNAISNFRRNKIRTFLSLLGIIIGVASVIVIMSMGQSSSQEIEDTFDSSGPDMVSVSKGFFRRNRSAVTINFDEEFREELFGEIEGIKKSGTKTICLQQFPTTRQVLRHHAQP